MSKFNDAELHAIKQLDPQGYLRWQIPDLDKDLEWYTWLETQVSPPQGIPFPRCDCVARSRTGGPRRRVRFGELQEERAVLEAASNGSRR